MPDVMVQVTEIAENVVYIRHMLEGDDFSPGLVQQVKANTADLHEMKENREKSGSSNSTLVAVAWVFLVAAVVVSLADRAVLISDIRHQLEINAGQALGVSLMLGLSAKGFIAVSVSIFISRITGNVK